MFQGYRANIWRILVLFLFVAPDFDPCLALSSKAPTTSRSAVNTQSRRKANHKHTATTTTSSKSKPWRYAQPKKSKWDIRHTKSFRFEIQIPVNNQVNHMDNDKDHTNTHNNFESLPLHKKPRESLSHVLGKGLLWALFKEQYAPAASPASSKQIFVETPIPGEDRFVPDVVAFDYTNLREEDEDDGGILRMKDSSRKSSRSQNHPAPPPEHSVQPPLVLQSQYQQPTFWGESGRMSADKAASLAWKYPHTHFVHLRWGYPSVSMDIFQEIEDAVLPALQHRTAPFEFCLLPGQPKDYLLLMASSDETGNNGQEDDVGTTVSICREDCFWRTARFDIDMAY